MNESGMVVLASVALLVRVGQALYVTGLSRSKNTAAAALRSTADFALAALAFWAFGWAVFRGDYDVVGLAPRLLFFRSADPAGVALAYLIFASISSAIVVGATAERARFFPQCAVPILLAGFVIPLAAHWAWTGWLSRLGFIDAAGATVVHLSGGACAAVAALWVGPRMGKYNRDGSSNAIPGHSIALTAAGVLLMLAAWIPYVLAGALLRGTTGVTAALNVLLSAAAGAFVSILYGQFRHGKIDVLLTFSGLLGGLVAISAGAATVNPLGAVVIGAAAGIIVPALTIAIDLWWKIDDPSGSIAIHAGAGFWGTLAVGFFAPGGIVGRLKLLGVQLFGAVVIALVSIALAVVVLHLLKITVGLRCKEADEYDGLDLAEHDINAYPDFQQTMIKSYHLREA